MAATILLGLLLMEGAIETFWRGSPIRWWILIAVGGWLCAMVPASLFLAWGGRLWLTTLAVLGVIVLAVWRLEPKADPSLAVLTVPLPHLLPLLILLALLLFGALVTRFRSVQRVPLLMVIVLLLTMYCLVPFAFAALYATPIDAVVLGKGYWTAPPLWLQGGFLALQLIVPLGFVVAALAWLGAVAGPRGRGSAVFPAICWLVFAAAFVVGSVELARAGIPNLASRYAPGWTPQSAQPAATATAMAPAAVATGGAGTAAVPAPGAQPSAGVKGQVQPGAYPLGRGATTRSVALTVESVEFASDVGGRSAPPGQMFVIVRTTWQNLTSLSTAAQPNAAPTPYVVPSVHDQLWLLTDGRYADPIDEPATEALDKHLPIGTLAVPAQGEAVTGQVAFRVAANASYIAMVLLDEVSGNALVSVKGRPVDAPPAPALGPSASNPELMLAITGAGWSENAPAAPAGLRYFTLGLRTVGNAPGSPVTIDLTDSGRLLADQGGSAEPLPVVWLKRPFPRPVAVLPGFPNEGQLAFLLPADTKSARFVLRLKSGGTIDLPVTSGFGSARPER